MYLYSSIVVLSCLSMLCLTSFVNANVLINQEQKKRFYISYILIIISILSEWGAVVMNGLPIWTLFIHKSLKLIDYLVTPVAGIYFVRQISKKKIDKFAISLMTINFIFQILSFYRGWSFYIDEANVYRQGEYYWLYIIIYILSFLYVVYGFYSYGKMFEKRKLLSLSLIVLIFFIGVIIQQVLKNEVRTTSLTLTLCSILLYIYYTDFITQNSDKMLSEQRVQLEHDVLTGLYNRYAFEKTVNMSEPHFIIKDLTVFSFDINGLKITNDTYGHEAGDELIKAAATIIDKNFSPYGRCYRIGGDEMVALLIIPQEKISNLINNFEVDMNKWHGEFVDELSMAYGYVRADFHPDCKLIELYKLADRYMYDNKEMHYLNK